jgi:hypothetical protein
MLAFLAVAHAAEALPTQGPFDAPHRYYAQSVVQLPLFMWFATPFNQQARATAFDLRLVLDCDAGVPNTRRTLEVLCTLEQVGLSATGMEQEAGLLQPILTELDDILTGSDVQLQVRGSEVVNVDLEVYRRNNRVGRLNENMRLVLSRAIAGLDFEPPPDAELEAWPEYGSMLAWMPAANGTSGTSQIVYKVTDRGERMWSLVYGGTGVLRPGEGGNSYDARFSGDLVMDAATGQILDRTWLVVATPTPSSVIAQGWAGYPYLQQGRLVALSPDQEWDVGESLEVPPSEFTPTAIQQQFQLGLPPNRRP